MKSMNKIVKILFIAILVLCMVGCSCNCGAKGTDNSAVIADGQQIIIENHTIEEPDVNPSDAPIVSETVDIPSVDDKIGTGEVIAENSAEPMQNGEEDDPVEKELPVDPGTTESKDKKQEYVQPNGSTDYEKYYAMSGEEQKEFFQSFADPADFFKWLDNARKEYIEKYPGIDIGDGVIDLGDYIDQQ